jgi:hypothetical protein
MDPEINDRANELADEVDYLSTFYRNHQMYPATRVKETYAGLVELIDTLPNTGQPSNMPELYQAEVKRRMAVHATTLYHWLSGKEPEPSQFFSMHGVSQEDIEALGPYLHERRDHVVQAMEKLYEISKHSHIGIPSNPDLEREAERFVLNNGRKYHHILGEFAEQIIGQEGFRNAVRISTSRDVRSHFHPALNIVAFSIPTTAHYTKNGELKLDIKEAIRSYAHEGIGHALNHFVTKSSDMPLILKRNCTPSESTQEAVALFYEQQVFEDLKDSVELQRALGIHESFDQIYQEAKLSFAVKMYHAMTERYAIAVVADKSLGDPREPEVVQKKMDLLSKVALSPEYPQAAVLGHARNFDRDGSLPYSILRELIYSVPAVDKAMEEFRSQGILYEGEGKRTIDNAMLTGLWTPKGFVDHARLVAQKK